MKKNNQTKQRFAIRKFTVGTGSALIASLVFVGMGASAHADTQPASLDPAISHIEPAPTMKAYEIKEADHKTSDTNITPLQPSVPTESSQVPQESIQPKPAPLEPATANENVPAQTPASTVDPAISHIEPAPIMKAYEIKEADNKASETNMTPLQPSVPTQSSQVPQESIQPKPATLEPATATENVPAQTPASTLDPAFSHAKPVEDSATKNNKAQSQQQITAQPSLDPEFSHVDRKETKTPTSQPAAEIVPAHDRSQSGNQNPQTKGDKHEGQQIAQTVIEASKAKNNKTIDAPTLIPAHKTEQTISEKTKAKTDEPVMTHVSASAPLNEDTASKDSNKPGQSKEVKEPTPQATAPRSVQQPASNQSESVSTKEKQTQSINKYPVIFVHGFMGFTGDLRTDLLPNYWGGEKYHIIDGLREKGYETYEASVGAFSSNYDRAVELYYYIKGGTVDYGAAHAKKYGHARYGRTYAGVFRDWQPGKKIHLVGHSMGGQTIRLLEHFLRFGNQEEIDYQRQHYGTISPLFKGGKDNMIASITTLGTPHNGTAAADRLGNQKAVKDIIYALGRMGGGKLGSIDFGFEKWGFKQGENESYIDYANRVAKSNLWNTDDNGMYDLTIEGSEKLNQQTPMNPNIVYTTYTGLASHEGLTGNYIPDLGQYFLLDATSRIVGSVPNKSLRPNDGIIPVLSSLHPNGQAFTDFTDGLKKGVWQVTPVMKGWDHVDLVGLDALDFKHTGQELQGFYAGLINNMMRVEELDA